MLNRKDKKRQKRKADAKADETGGNDKGANLIRAAAATTPITQTLSVALPTAVTGEEGVPATTTKGGKDRGGSTAKVNTNLGANAKVGGLLKLPKGLISEKKSVSSIATSFERLQRPSVVDDVNKIDKKKELYHELMTSVDLKQTLSDNITVKIKKLSSMIEKVMNDNRKNKDWMLAFCSNISSDVMNSVDEFEDLFMELLDHDIAAAMECEFVDKYVNIRGKMIHLFQIVLNSPPSSSISHSKPHITRTYIHHLDVALEKTLYLLRVLQAKMAQNEKMNVNMTSLMLQVQLSLSLAEGKKPTLSPLQLYNDLSVLSLFLGKLYTCKEDESSRLEQSYQRNNVKSQSMYMFASAIAPWSGSGLKAQAQIATDSFLIVHLLSRSMCTLQPYDAHEALLNIFEQQKSTSLFLLPFPLSPFLYMYPS